MVTKERIKKYYKKIIRFRKTNAIASDLEKQIEEDIPKIIDKIRNNYIELYNTFNYNKLNKTKGLYYIEANFKNCNYIKFSEEFKEDWNKHRKNNNNKSAQYYEKKIENHIDQIENNEFIPFYLGKTEELKKRIEEHIFEPTCKTTYALRLNLDIIDNSRLEQIEFRLNYIPIKTDQYWLIELYEKKLRSKLNPIVGKQ